MKWAVSGGKDERMTEVARNATLAGKKADIIFAESGVRQSCTQFKERG